MAKDIFITGMMRSGTSLIQVLLTNHPQLFVASQPFHQLYVDVKQLFLDEHGLQEPLPLGDGMNAQSGGFEQFTQWLKTRRFNLDETIRLVTRSIMGKGGGAVEFAGKLSAKPGSFYSIRDELHASIASHFSPHTQLHALSYVGSKDAFCEEYIPGLLSEGVRCLLIVRDPRAVIASACHGKYREGVGDRYPILMLIRLWRKSVAYWLAFNTDPSVFAIRYEDIVLDPVASLQKISQWLDIQSFSEDFLSQPFYDHAGRSWNGNSSFGEKSGIDNATQNIWETLLTAEEIRFIEACTKPELRSLGYAYNPDLQSCDIADFCEDVSNVRESYLKSYGLTPENRRLELERWDMAERGQFNSAGESRLFLFPEAYSKVGRNEDSITCR